MRRSSKIIEKSYSFLGHNQCLTKTNIMAVFSGEVTIKVKFNKVQIPVGFGMTSAHIHSIHSSIRFTPN